MTNYERVWIIDYLGEDIDAGLISEEEAQKRLAYAEYTGECPIFERDNNFNTNQGSIPSRYTSNQYRSFNQQKG